jgi:hypothetical protein
MRKIDEIVVHCTATPANWREGQKTPTKVAEVKRWHTDERGWSDIGYHFLIDRDGTTVGGRPVTRKGAHVRGHNDYTIGVALFGGHGGSENDNFEDHFTPEQDRALRQLIARLRREHGANLKLSGHNEYAAKACPCFNVRRWYAGKPSARQSITESHTMQAAGAGAVTAVGTGAAAVSQLDSDAQVLTIVLIGVIVLAFAIIMRERLKKWAKGDR